MTHRDSGATPAAGADPSSPCGALEAAPVQKAGLGGGTAAAAKKKKRILIRTEKYSRDPCRERGDVPWSGGAALPRSSGRAFWGAEHATISQRQLKGLFPPSQPPVPGGWPWGLSRSVPAALAPPPRSMLRQKLCKTCRAGPKPHGASCVHPAWAAGAGKPPPGCPSQGASRCPLRHGHPTGRTAALHARRPRGECNRNGLFCVFQESGGDFGSRGSDGPGFAPPGGDTALPAPLPSTGPVPPRAARMPPELR